MPVYPYQGRRPRLGKRVFLAPSAELSGDIELGDDVSFWFHTAARGDVHWMKIGARTNIQDGSVLHVSHGTHPLSLGTGVVVGHHAVLHGCTVEDSALIGIGARVLDGAVVEHQAQVGAAAVVPPGMVVPAGHLVLGVPAKVHRPLTDEEKAHIETIAERYVRLKEEYRQVLAEGREGGG